MTENELIKTHIEECEHRIGKILGFMESNEDANVDGCKGNIEVLKTVVIALEEVKQYRAIGTVEEFKDLKDKSVTKKPYLDQKGMLDVKMWHCPVCNKEIISDWNRDLSNEYCPRCGQKLDWQ